jgi:hypothetical protein
MKSENITLLIISLLLFTSFADGEPNDFKPVSSNDVNYVLNMLAAHIQDNYDRINTWEGEIEYTYHKWYRDNSAEIEFRDHVQSNEQAPGEFEKTANGKKGFVIDSKKDNISIHYIPIGQMSLLDTKTNRSFESDADRREETVIVTPNYLMECGPYRYDYKGNKKELVQRIGIKRPVPSNPMMTWEEDPRVTLKSRGLPIWIQLESLIKKGLKQGGFSIKLEKRADNGFVEYRLEEPVVADGNAFGLMRMIFPGNKGFIITEYEYTDTNGNIQAKQTIDFTLIDGIYLPSLRHTLQYDENGRIQTDKTEIFKNIRVNKTIPEDSFTYENAGLKNGDFVKDEITNKKYEYRDANLILITEPNSSEGTHPPK